MKILTTRILTMKMMTSNNEEIKTKKDGQLILRFTLEKTTAKENAKENKLQIFLSYKRVRLRYSTRVDGSTDRCRWR